MKKTTPIEGATLATLHTEIDRYCRRFGIDHVWTFEKLVICRGMVITDAAAIAVNLGVESGEGCALYWCGLLLHASSSSFLCDAL